MRRIGDHAVVLGASLAGLLAARVLSDTYGRVTVVERDPLPERLSIGGVSQGRRPSAAAPRDADLDELFPGLLDDLAAGAPRWSGPAELRFSPGGHRLCLGATLAPRLPGQPALSGRPGARPGRALATVQIIDRCEVVGVVTTAAETASPGTDPARHRRRRGTLDADLVLDATGAAAARRPGWRRSATTNRRKSSSRST